MIGKSNLHNLDTYQETVLQSRNRRTYLEFCQWLRNYVSKYIPYEKLIVARGNFGTREVQVDLLSSLDEEKHCIYNNKNIISLMTDIFKKWKNSENQWYFDNGQICCELSLVDSLSEAAIEQSKKMYSTIVSGYHDEQTDHDVMYVFLNANNSDQINEDILSMFVPHIDVVMRSIERKEEIYANNIASITNVGCISNRELQVLELVMMGNTNVEIADKLFISLNTVKNHLKNIFRKMEVSSRAEAVAKFLVEIEPKMKDQMTMQNYI